MGFRAMPCVQHPSGGEKHLHVARWGVKRVPMRGAKEAVGNLSCLSRQGGGCRCSCQMQREMLESLSVEIVVY